MKKTYISPVLEVTEVASEHYLCAGSGDADLSSIGNPDGDYHNEEYDDDDIDDDNGNINAQGKGWNPIGGFWDD